MQLLLFVITGLFPITAHLSSTDLFDLDSEFPNNDISNPDAQLMFGGDDGSQLSTNNMWTGGGSDFLDEGTGTSNDQNFDLSSPSIFDESSNLQPSFPLDSSTLPGAVSLSDQENSIAVGGGCSSNGMMSNPISRRGDFDWFWNMFKIPDLEPKTAPDICPADSEDGAVKPQPKKGDDGGSDEPNEDYAICNGIFLVCCIGNPIRDPDEDIDVMESCWNFKPAIRPACRNEKALWCCDDYWPDSGIAIDCKRAFPDAV